MRKFDDFLEQPVSELAGPLLGAVLHEGDSIPAGTRVGPYRVIRELGRGGMGIVCLAQRADANDGDRVALKVLLRRFTVEPATLRRFREEPQILAPLDHSEIVRLLDVGVEGDGTPWFAMEYVEGVPLDRYSSTHGLDLRRKLDLFAKACDAVELAHRLFIVHRDLKPSHILVTPAGAVKLLDFGIAKLAAPGGAVGPMDPTFTQPQLLTPAYASPEQLRGERATTASDVYALGVILYRLLAGRLPKRTTAHYVRGTTTRSPESPPALPPDLPAALHDITAKALQPEPEHRYLSAGALAADVRAFLSGANIVAPPRGAMTNPLGRIAARLRALPQRLRALTDRRTGT